MSDLTLDELLKKKGGTAQEEETPVLTLDPGKLADKAAAESEHLSPQQLNRAKEIRKSIDLTDASLVLQYGAGIQRDVQAGADHILERARQTDHARAGQLLEDLAGLLEGAQADLPRENGRRSLFHSSERELKKAVKDFEKAEVQVDRIAMELERERTVCLRDIAVLDEFYDRSLEQFRQFQVYILAGEKALHDTRQETIPGLREQAARRGDAMSGQAVRDFEANVDLFEKKLHEMKVSKTIALQTAPQIRLIQNGDRLLAARIQTALTQTIPLWKNQMAIALGLERQQDALKRKG